MSGAASLLMALMGGAPGVINGALPNGTAATQASFKLNSDGTYTISGQSAGNWINPATAVVAAQWQVKLDVTAGGIDTGTTGSYLDLSGSPEWIVNIGGTVAAVFTLTFREKASQTVRSTQAGVELTST